jgi:large subunit ribosomal protein L21
LYVPHIEGKSGDKVEFSEVLMTDNAGKVSIGSNVKAIVKAEILSDLVQGDKVIAFKMKRRKGFRKKHGHRTHYTKIQVTEIA